MSSIKRKWSSYDASFKLRIIEFAENSNNSAAERQYGVSEKLVRDGENRKRFLQTCLKQREPDEALRRRHFRRWRKHCMNGYQINDRMALLYHGLPFDCMH